MPNGNIQNGAPVNEVQSSPSVVNGVVYVGAGDGNVYALNADNGKKIWNCTTENFGGNTGNTVASSPAVVNGVVYAGSYNGFVYALKASNGAEIWSSEIGAITVSSPAVASGVLYIGSGYYGTGDDNVYAFNAATGKLLWTYDTNGQVWSSPIVVNGVVYVGSGEDTLYALGSTSSQNPTASPSPAIPEFSTIISVIVILALTATTLLFTKKLKKRMNNH